MKILAFLSGFVSFLSALGIYGGISNHGTDSAKWDDGDRLVFKILSTALLICSGVMIFALINI